MNRHLLVLTSAIALAARAPLGAIDLSHANSEHDYEHQHEKMQQYTCLMHPDVITDHPGNCPKCGMKLVPLKEKKRRTSNIERPTPTARATETHESHTAHASHEMHEMQMEMHSTVDLADPMSREGSGTSWLPDSSPMYGRMFMFGENMLMLHGAIFPR